MDKTDPGYAGYRDYNRGFLRIYDAWVLGFMAPRVWKVGDGPGLDLYERHTGRRHLDVGPGTGYFLERASLPDDLELTLVDPNPDVLTHCAERLSDLEPALVEGNLLGSLGVDGPFDSAALMHVLHCLPDPMASKATAVANVASVLTDDGVLFGGTVLGPDAPGHNAFGRWFVRMANRVGGFSNLEDDTEGLRSILEASFEEVAIDDSAPIAYFSARRPRRP